MIVFISIAPASFYQNSLRQEVLSFSAAMQVVTNRIFIKNPLYTFNYTVYLNPLTYFSWFCIFMFLVLVPIALYLFNANSKVSKFKFSLMESYELAFMALLGIGSSYNPSSYSSRILFYRYTCNNWCSLSFRIILDSEF